MKQDNIKSGACVPEGRTGISRSEGSRPWSYIWLAYSGFYFIEPALRHDLRYWMETVFVYCVFLTIYVGINKAVGLRRQLAVVAILFLLGIVDYPRNQGASSFLIYVAGFLPFFLSSMRWVVSLVLIDCAALCGEGVWLIYRSQSHHDLSSPINLAISAFFVLVVGISNFVVAQQKRADYKLHRAEREIVQLAAVAERERIARDLHDVLGHTLSVIVLKAELAGRLMQRDPQRAAAEIADVERTARTALSEVREAIGGYRTQGLAAEMSVARRALDAAGVVLTLEEIDALHASPALGDEMQTVFSLTLREAVTNIVRHAHATHCRVSFTTADGHHALLIEDDGTHPVLHEGNGLRGMRERIQRIGGTFLIETGRGTKLRIAVPVSAGERA